MFQLTRRLQLAVKPRYKADTPSLEQRKYPYMCIEAFHLNTYLATVCFAQSKAPL